MAKALEEKSILRVVERAEKTFTAAEKKKIIEAAEAGDPKTVVNDYGIGRKQLKKMRNMKTAVYEMFEIDPNSTKILKVRQRKNLKMKKEFEEWFAVQSGKITTDQRLIRYC